MLIALLAIIRSADACSCIAPSPERSGVLADGATDFPVDGALRVFAYAFPPALRARLGEEYRLRDGAGALVPLVARVDDIVLTLSPQSPLSPDAQYTVERVYAYDADGVQLSDGERWSSLRPVRPAESRVAQRLWFPEASFHTAGVYAHRVDPVVAVHDAKVFFAQGGGDCGPGSGLAVHFDVNGDLPRGDVLVAQVQGHGDIGWFVARESGLFAASDMLCTPDKVHLGYQGPFDVRIEVLHADGSRAPATAWLRATEDSPPPVGVKPQPEWTDTKVYDGWFEPAAAESTGVASSPAPASCPYGLEVERTTHLGPDIFAWLSPDTRMGGDEDSEPEWNEGVATVDSSSALLRGPHWSRIVKMDSTDAIETAWVRWSVTTHGRPTGADMATDRAGSVVALFSSEDSVERPEEASWLDIAALRPDGGEAWSSLLTTDGFNRAPHVALAGDTVLLAWDVQAKGGARSVRWIVVDRATGAQRGAFEMRTPLGLGDDLRVAAVDADGQYALLWQVAEGDRQHPDFVTVIARVSLTGQIVDTLEVRGLEWVSAITSAKGQLVLLSSGFNNTRVDEVDLKTASIARSTGLGGPYSDLHLVSADGQLYVTWSAERAQPSIAMLDGGGDISPALPLDFGDMDVGGGDGGPAVAHTPYIAPPRVDHFRCRSTPGASAPARLGAMPDLEPPTIARTTLTGTEFVITPTRDRWAWWAMVATIVSFIVVIVTAARMLQRARTFMHDTPTIREARDISAFRRLVAQHTSARVVLIGLLCTSVGLARAALRLGAPEVPWFGAVGVLVLVSGAALLAVAFTMRSVRTTPSIDALTPERNAIVRTWRRSVFPPWGPAGR